MFTRSILARPDFGLESGKFDRRVLLQNTDYETTRTSSLGAAQQKAIEAYTIQLILNLYAKCQLQSFFRECSSHIAIPGVSVR